MPSSEATMPDTTDTRPSIAELQALRTALADGEYAAIMRLIDAAPVLLEIVAAALEHQVTKKSAAQQRAKFYRSQRDSDLVGIEALDKEEIRCRDALNAALAKVQP